MSKNTPEVPVAAEAPAPAEKTIRLYWTNAQNKGALNLAWKGGKVTLGAPGSSDFTNVVQYADVPESAAKKAIKDFGSSPKYPHRRVTITDVAPAIDSQALKDAAELAEVREQRKKLQEALDLLQTAKKTEVATLQEQLAQIKANNAALLAQLDQATAPSK